MPATHGSWASTGGRRPNTVTFTSNTFGTINFGDGQSSGMAFNDAVYQIQYTYQSAGDDNCP